MSSLSSNSTSNPENHDPPLKPSTLPHHSSTSLTPTASSNHSDEGQNQTKTEKFRNLADQAKIWLKDPIHKFQAAMLAIIIVGGAGIFLLMVGWLKLRNEDQKILWIEIFSQILNAIFTLSAVIPQPLRLRSIVRAIKLECLNRKIGKNEGRTMEEAEDKTGPGKVDKESKIGKIWSKIALDFPWMVGHGELGKVVPRITSRRLLLIMTFLNLHCLTQYVITIAMWGWPPSTRPALMVLPMIPISFLSNIVGGVLLGRGEAEANRAEKKEMNAPTERKA